MPITGANVNDWINAVAVADLAPGGHAVIELDGTMIALFNLDGQFYAIEDVCTHDGSEIAGGCIIGDQIECPRHGARFSLKTGEVTAPPAYEAVETFPVRVVDSVVQVRDHRWD